jgi:hypothetical protein
MHLNNSFPSIKEAISGAEKIMSPNPDAISSSLEKGE